MRICIDIQSAIAQRAGVGRYTYQLVGHMAGQIAEDAISLFCFDFKGKGVPFDAPQADIQRVRWCPGRAAQYAWKTLGWPPFDLFAGRFDVYHFPNFFLPPLRHGRSVVTIHDVSFLRHPEFAEDKNLQFLTRHIRKTVERADAIITDSRFSANEIRDVLNVDEARLFPIHLGISPLFRPPDEQTQAATLARLGCERPYLLTVGTLEPRKNVPFLIELFERMTDFDGELVIAGMPGWKFEPIVERMQSSSRAADIRYLNFVPDADLPSLYAGAELFLLASRYEGFGFPPLEAMACGTPVVSSSGGSLAEVLGDSAVVLEGFEHDEWREAAERILADTGHRNALRTRGRHRAAGYDWAATAGKTLQVYRAAGS